MTYRAIEEPGSVGSTLCADGMREETMNPLTTLIISDIDGCLANTIEHLLIYIWDQYRVAVPMEVIDEFDVREAVYSHIDQFEHTRQRLGGLKNEVERPYERGAPFHHCGFDNFCEWIKHACWCNPHFYREIKPFIGYWQALLGWNACLPDDMPKGVNLQFLTARPLGLRSVTREWMGRYDFQPHQLKFSNVKLSYTTDDLKHSTKANHVAEIISSSVVSKSKQVVYIEDRIKDAVDVAKAIPEMKVWLRAQQWNAWDSADWERAGISIDMLSYQKYDSTGPEGNAFIHWCDGMPENLHRYPEEHIVRRINDAVQTYRKAQASQATGTGRDANVHSDLAEAT